jgi:hypothetical protein
MDLLTIIIISKNLKRGKEIFQVIQKLVSKEAISFKNK